MTNTQHMNTVQTQKIRMKKIDQMPVEPLRSHICIHFIN